MPNKDSFTFSDKLKKSKSLPLSKRIPSRVGGDGKAKRTLIQRAQRDLPFIIVAAAALLLLPVLSRDNGGTDYEGATSGYNDFVPAEEGAGFGVGGGANDIAPSSSFRDPMSLIIRKGGEDTSAIHNSPDTEDYNYNASDDSGVVTSSKSTSSRTFAPAAREAVRNAVERKATQINALRNSKTFMGGSGGGISRTLAVGSAPKTAASGPSVRSNARPVALQPMTSAGRGGRGGGTEGMYAEAARSMGALNAGPSKQALYDAQLRNVDGTPLGAVGGAPMIGGGSRIGVGGVPSNNVNYKPQLPWWWDFEKQKIMDRWKLWHYNFEAALSNSLVKIGTGLFQCLATGNADGKIDKFLGDAGGGPDYECVGASGILSWNDERDIAGDTTSGSGENQEAKSNANLDAWWTRCQTAGGTPTGTTSGRKDMLDVRLRCLGLKYKNTGLYNLLKSVKYMEKNNCVNVNSDPMSFEFVATKGKNKKEKNFGFYILARNTDSEKRFSSNSDKKVELKAPQVICIGKGATLTSDCAERITVFEANGWKITDVRAFTASKKKLRDQEKMDSYREEIERLKSMSDTDIKKIYGDKTAHDTAIEDFEKKYDNAKMANEKSGNDTGDKDITTPTDFESTFTKIRNMVNLAVIDKENNTISNKNPVYEPYIEEHFNVKVEASCKVNRLAKVSINGLRYIETAQNPVPKVRDMSEWPDKNELTGLKPLAHYTFAAVLEGTAKYMYVAVVETAQSVGSTNETQNNKYKTMEPELVVFRDYSNVGNKEIYNEGAAYKIGLEIGKAGNSTDLANGQSVPGTGKVFWVASSVPLTSKLSIGQTVKGKTDTQYVLFSDLFATADKKDSASIKEKVGIYRWGCTQGSACGKDDVKVQAQEFCRGEDGKIFAAAATDNGETFLALDNIPIGRDDPALEAKIKASVAGYSKDCNDCYNKYAASLKPCQPICKKAEKIYKAKANNGGLDAEGDDPFDDTLLKTLGVDTKNCKVCNEKPEAQIVEAKKDDACNFAIDDKFSSGSYRFKSTAEENAFTDKVSRLYTDCIMAKNADGSSKTGNVTVNVIGITDFQSEPGRKGEACTDGNTCKLDPFVVGSKNVGLSEARAIAAAQLISKTLSFMDKDKALKIKYEFNSKVKDRELASFKNLGTYISDFTPGAQFGEGSRIVTIKITGQGSYKMYKEKIEDIENRRDNPEYRKVFIRTVNENDNGDGSEITNTDETMANKFITGLFDAEDKKLFAIEGKNQSSTAANASGAFSS